jgi:hypothetical protein
MLFNNFKFNFPLGTGQAIHYLLRDDFTDTVAAGSVNGTTATPTGGVRTVIDTNSKLSIASGTLLAPTGGAGTGNPKITYTTIPRIAGRVVMVKHVAPSGFGLEFCSSPGGMLMEFGNIQVRPGTLVTGVCTIGAVYINCVVWRALGALNFIRGGSQYPQWTLAYPSKTGSGEITLDISYRGTTGFINMDWFRVPENLISITPLASDAFTRADGLLGDTGGGGGEESGGGGLAWTANLGVWGVATNKAASSALDGTANISIATVDAGSTNIMAEVVATRIAGTSGLILRYTDANNYIKCVHNGTNLQVIEVVAGTPSTKVNAAATYGAAARMIVSLNGTKLRAYYADALIGSEQTMTIATGNNHGLFTDDISATFDNFVVWAKGNGGEYEALFNKYTT